MRIEKIRNRIVDIIKLIPSFRGLDRICRIINWTFLRLGADPITTVICENGTNIIIDLRSITEFRIYYKGDYDSFEISTICSLLDYDSVFMDIGANIGFYTVAIANEIKKRNASGHVFSFEPLHSNYYRTIENISINNLSELVSVFEVGLSDNTKGEYITLRDDFEKGSETGNASIVINKIMDKNYRKEKIKLITLDSFWNNYNSKYKSIDIVKMDIEGHEDKCLKGAINTFNKHRPTIIMEVNKPYFDARNVDVNYTLLKYIPDKYSIFRRQESNWVKIDSLSVCNNVENIYLVPKEKMQEEKYKIFL